MTRLLTLERVKEVLTYDPETGIFLRKSAGKRTDLIGSIAGTNALGYVLISIDGRKCQAHRLAFLFMTGSLPSMDVDHIDGCGLNNAWRNLRECSHSQNLCNRRIAKHNRSGIKGVWWDKQENKWRSEIRFAGKVIRLGYFRSVELAAEFRQLAADMLHGEFARHA